MKQCRGMVWGVLLALCAAPAFAADAPAATSDAKAQHLADRLLQILPFGPVMDEAAKKDPTWPMQDKAGNVAPGKLACLRTELSSPGYRASRLRLATDYVAQNPTHIDADLRVLDKSAKVMGKAIEAGFQQASGGKDLSADEVLKDVAADEMLAMLEFLGDAKYQPLRELTGYDGAFDKSASSKDNESNGEDAGKKIVIKLVFEAMTVCDVPPSAFL